MIENGALERAELFLKSSSCSFSGFSGVFIFFPAGSCSAKEDDGSISVHIPLQDLDFDFAPLSFCVLAGKKQ